MPLSPDSYFKIRARWYERTVHTNTKVIVPQQKSFLEKLFNNFQWSAQVGFGQGLIHKEFDVYVGVGLSYNFNSVFGG